MKKSTFLGPLFLAVAFLFTGICQANTNEVFVRHLKKARENAFLGNFGLADSFYKRALSSKGCPPSVYQEHSLILKRMSRYKEALRALLSYKNSLKGTPPTSLRIELWKLRRLSIIEQTVKESPKRNPFGHHPMAGGNPRSGGWSWARGPKKPQTSWRRKVTGPVSAEVITDNNGNLFVGTRRGWFYALTPRGSIIWKKLLDGPIPFAAAIQGSKRLFVTTAARSVWALDPSTGKTLWKKTLTRQISNPPQLNPKGHLGVLAGRLFVFQSNGRILVQWGPKVCRGGPIYSKGHWYVGCDDGTVWAVKPTKKGSMIVWKNRCGKHPITEPPAASVSGMILFASSKGTLCAYSPHSQVPVLWKKKLSHGFTTSPLLGRGGQIFIGTKKGMLVHLSAYGKKLPSTHLSPGQPVVSRPLMDRNGFLFAGTQTGHLVIFNQIGRIMKKISFGVDVDSPPVATPRGFLVFGTDNGEIINIESHVP